MIGVECGASHLGTGLLFGWSVYVLDYHSGWMDGWMARLGWAWVDGVDTLVNTWVLYVG